MIILCVPKMYMENNQLIVKTFGEYSVEWNDLVLTGGSRSSDTQLRRVLQILLHFRDDGVSKAQLIEILDEDSKADDIHHLFRSVLYNVRNKLRKAGLPESEYIEYRNGKYYWTEDIDVWEDSRAFEELFDKASRTTDRETKKNLLFEACELYNGTFLPMQTRLGWVLDEEERYERLFGICAESLAKMLREDKDYNKMRHLGKHAVRVAPFREWEVVEIEALVELGRYREAQEVYENTLERYEQNVGVRPSQQMIRRFREISGSFNYRLASAAKIAGELAETKPAAGGFFCSFPMFVGIFRGLHRFSQTFGGDNYMMTCTMTLDNVVDADASLPDDEAMTKLSEHLKQVICNAVNACDIVCRYAKEEYIVLLVNRSIEDCYDATERITRSFKQGKSNVCLEYDIIPMY